MMQILKLILSVFIITLLCSFNVSAQCSVDDDALDECSNELDRGFRYLKTYDVDAEGEFSYVFSRGNTYLIQTCDSASLNKDMKITILDRTKHKIAANYDRQGVVSTNYLAYRCNSTSIYYLKFETDSRSDEECGAAVLGFK